MPTLSCERFILATHKAAPVLKMIWDRWFKHLLLGFYSFLHSFWHSFPFCRFYAGFIPRPWFHEKLLDEITYANVGASLSRSNHRRGEKKPAYRGEKSSTKRTGLKLGTLWSRREETKLTEKRAFENLAQMVLPILCKFTCIHGLLAISRGQAGSKW